MKSTRAKRTVLFEVKIILGKKGMNGENCI
jgi:hypothetical protein